MTTELAGRDNRHDTALRRAGYDSALFLLVTGLPMIAAAWALLSPGHVLSREMTWDLLFNLAGAWHIASGHAAHVDFHEPVGKLTFLLTALGFRLVGPTPLALVVGCLAWTTVTFVAAALVALRRLTFVPAAIFVVFACLLVAMPANVGDPPRDYSFAMSYNRYGWSALCVLALVLFVSPRPTAWGHAIDMAVAGALMVALFYLKITYFGAGLAAFGVALLLYPHMRAHWLGWLAIGIAVVANALAPYSHPYLIDIWNAAQAGQARTGLGVPLDTFLGDAAANAAYVAGLGLAFWLWWSGRAPLRLAAAIVFLIASGLLLLTQNHQARGLPLGVMIAFLLYDAMRRLSPSGALALMAFPLAAIATAAFSLAGYAVDDPRFHTVTRTQLAGLAVPAEPAGLLDAFAGARPDPSLLSRARILRPPHEITPAEYVDTLIEAADLFETGRLRPGEIVVLDQVNPLPFMLGIPPPRHGTLWSGWGTPALSAATLLADTDHVFIPKFSTFSPWTERAVRLYGEHLADHFAHRLESRSWIVLSRPLD